MTLPGGRGERGRDRALVGDGGARVRVRGVVVGGRGDFGGATGTFPAGVFSGTVQAPSHVSPLGGQGDGIAAHRDGRIPSGAVQPLAMRPVSAFWAVTV